MVFPAMEYSTLELLGAFLFHCRSNFYFYIDMYTTVKLLFLKYFGWIY